MLKNAENIALRSLHTFSIFVLRAEIVTINISGSKMVTISARNTNILKICKLRKAIFSAFYNISQPNFAILLILISSLYGNLLFLPKSKISLTCKLSIRAVYMKKLAQPSQQVDYFLPCIAFKTS